MYHGFGDFSLVPPFLLYFLLNLSSNYPNLFVSSLLIPLQTSRKAASLEAFFLPWLAFFFAEDFARGGRRLFWLFDGTGGERGGAHLEGDGDAAMPWNTSSSSSSKALL
jgi:hypothetical protein